MYNLTLQKNELEKYKESTASVFAITALTETTITCTSLIIAVFATNEVLLAIAGLFLIRVLLIPLGEEKVLSVKIFAHIKEKKLKEKCINDLCEIFKALDNSLDAETYLYFLKEILDIKEFVKENKDITKLFYETAVKLFEKIATSNAFKGYFLLEIASKSIKPEDTEILENMFKFLKDEAETIKEKSGFDSRIPDEELNETLKIGSKIYNNLVHGVYTELSDYMIIRILLSLFYQNNKDEIMQVEFNLKSLIPILKERKKNKEEQLLKDIKEGKVRSQINDEYEDYLEKLLKI